MKKIENARKPVRTAQSADDTAIRRAVELTRAHDELFSFCHYIDPRFFKSDRPHLIRLCDTLDRLVTGRLLRPDGTPYKKLIISIPPRHGKSYTMSMANQWMLGRNAETRIINVSYNETLSVRFAKGVRDGIKAEKLDKKLHIYRDIFPDTRIAEGDGAAQVWSLEGQFFNFLAAGFGGTITGVGCNVLIVDDPIKNHLEANNARLLDEQWRYYTDTLFSRVEENGVIIFIMTRWNTRDLAGRALSEEPDEWYELRMPACVDEGEKVMLCPALLSYQSYEQKRKITSPEILLANYQQQPIDVTGRLYERFSHYELVPAQGDVICYIDTADTGADYLCALCAKKHEGEGFVLDVLYTDAPMDKTETAVAELLIRHKVDTCVIESNNGGMGFARNVERILWEKYRWRRTRVIKKAQRQNKVARILTQAAFIEDHIFFPADFDIRWPTYALAMRDYQRKGKNAHDDAPDATTGLAETIQGRGFRRRDPLT